MLRRQFSVAVAHPSVSGHSTAGPRRPADHEPPQLTGRESGAAPRRSARSTGACVVSWWPISRPHRKTEVLADGADLLVIEATFLSEDLELATRYGHLTARQAARLAAECGCDASC